MFFKDRIDAGRMLAEAIQETGRDFSGFNVIGIARGGVIIAEQVAKQLGLGMQAVVAEDLDTKKGTYVAVSVGGDSTYFFSAHYRQGNDTKLLDDVTKERLAALTKLATDKHRRFNPEEPEIRNQPVLLCDDGFVSGKTVKAVVKALRDYGIKQIIVAIPVIPAWVPNAHEIDFEILTWRLSTLANPTTGMFYFSFEDTPDQEVIRAVTELHNSPLGEFLNL